MCIMNLRRRSFRDKLSKLKLSPIKKPAKKKSANRSRHLGKKASNCSSVSRKSFDGYLGDLNLKISNNINSKSSNRMTTRISHRVSENNTIKSNEKSSDLSLKNTIRASPRLAAKKKIEEKKIGHDNVSIKNGQTTILNRKSINNLSHKARGKISNKTSIIPKNSGINEKSIDKASVCSESKTDNIAKQIRKKEISKMTFELNQSNLQFRSNSSQYGLRLLGKKTNLCDNSMGVASNNSLDYHSKTFRSLKLSRLRSERPLSGKHTVPLRKKTKKLLRRKTEETKNSRSPSKVSSQINEFPYLNNVPTDDLGNIPFYSPKCVNKMRQNIVGKKGIVITSTPHFKKSTKQQLLKKQNKKFNDCKVSKKKAPSKGSLKRKRQLMKSLKEKNEEYEDDIYENCSFSRFKSLFENDSDSDTSTASIATPKCSLLITSYLPVKTPRFKDCYDPQELLKARKLAEEYMYRRNKRRKNLMNSTPLTKEDSLELSTDENILGSIASTSPKNPAKISELDFMSVIEQYKKKMAELEKNDDDDDDDDDYFSDT